MCELVTPVPYHFSTFFRERDIPTYIYILNFRKHRERMCQSENKMPSEKPPGRDRETDGPSVDNDSSPASAGDPAGRPWCQRDYHGLC